MSTFTCSPSAKPTPPSRLPCSLARDDRSTYSLSLLARLRGDLLRLLAQRAHRAPLCSAGRQSPPPSLSSPARHTTLLARLRLASTRDLVFITFSIRHVRHSYATRQSAIQRQHQHRHPHQHQHQPNFPYGIPRVFFPSAATGPLSGPNLTSAAHARAVPTAPAPPSPPEDTQGSS
ncbi:hypothetical protein V8E36_008149 [Tilletia maclaganii]